jgi:mono/diheme cytochrome c family protein
LVVDGARPCAAAVGRDFGRGRSADRAERGGGALCQFCHKWDASGDQGYGGNALSLRATQLTPEQLTEVVKCGRPGTGMPYHDRFAYTDKRCYGYTSDQLGSDMPPAGNDFLSAREVEAVVKYLFAKDVGRGPATYEDCVDFWGKDTQQCQPMKK